MIFNTFARFYIQETESDIGINLSRLYDALEGKLLYSIQLNLNLDLKMNLFVVSYRKNYSCIEIFCFST